MVVSEDIRKEIKKRVELYDDTKEKIKTRIRDNISIAIERLKAVEKDLLYEVDEEFGENPLVQFLVNKEKDTDTDAEAKRLLIEQKITENFGPDEKSFSTLLKDIDSFRAWQNKLNPLYFVPKELRTNDVTCDSIALSWVAVKSNSDCVYEIELMSLTLLKSVHHSDKPEYTLYNLKPGTEYHIRVRSVLFHKDMTCIWSNPITVKTKSLHVRDVVVKAVSWSGMDVSWETDDECDKEVEYTVEMRKEGDKDWKEAKSGLTDKKCRVKRLMDNSVYEFRVRCVAKGGSSLGEWSDIARRITPKKYECAWKECPGYVESHRKYSVCGRNFRIATKVSGNGGWFNDNDQYCSTIIGDTHIPSNTIISWNIGIFNLMNDRGKEIFIGIAPNDINQNNDNYDNCGWYFGCYRSALYSGPPHNYGRKGYGPKKYGQYVYTGDSVGVLVDTTKGDLSFVLNGVNLGVAYEGIPLDKPLVPCVILWKGDSVELDTSKVKENVDSSVPIPSNITIKGGITWDSITLTWDEVPDASFYQVEVDGSKSWDASPITNTFTKRGLLPETENNFRVRTVRGNSVSEWSGVVKGRTLKAPEFSECAWKKCPDDVDDDRRYSVDGRNLRIATNINAYPCTIIGNTPIPLNAVTSWSIKILKSKNNNGDIIYVGIAPNDINQNDVNYNTCGWYFDCYCSELWSGPPHNYKIKTYGPRKDSNGQYVHTRDSLGVVMDTSKGKLSFVLNGVNLGVAYKRIPLDKPLVPCVLLGYEGDSVELDLSEVKENVASSVPVPSNTAIKNITWGSAVDGTSIVIYQY